MNTLQCKGAIAALVLAVQAGPSHAAASIAASAATQEPTCASAPQALSWRSSESGSVAVADIAALRGRRVWVDAKADERHASELNLSLLLAIDSKPDGSMLFGQNTQLFAPPGNASTTTLTSWIGNGWSRLDVRLPASADDAAKGITLQMRCSKRVSTYGAQSSQQALLDEALNLYLARALKAPADAATIRRQAQGWATGAEEPDDVFMALRAVMFNLGDYHSYLVPRVERGAFFAMLAPRPPDVRMRPDGIGVVHVSQVGFDDEQAGVAYARALSDAVARVAARHPRGWIVDLRQFGGGNMWIVLAGLSSLVDGPLVGEFVSKRDRDPWLVSGGRAGTLGQPDIVAVARPDAGTAGLPVAVLIGPGTTSSGESTAIAFEGRRDTRVFGQPTLGIYDSGVTQFTLSDGTMFGIAEARYADRAGRVYDGPVVPDQLVDSTQDAQAVAAAWLLQQRTAPDRRR